MDKASSEKVTTKHMQNITISEVEFIVYGLINFIGGVLAMYHWHHAVKRNR